MWPAEVTPPVPLALRATHVLSEAIDDDQVGITLLTETPGVIPGLGV
jgi:hypothetical protein